MLIPSHFTRPVLVNLVKEGLLLKLKSLIVSSGRHKKLGTRKTNRLVGIGNDHRILGSLNNLDGLVKQVLDSGQRLALFDQVSRLDFVLNNP